MTPYHVLIPILAVLVFFLIRAEFTFKKKQIYVIKPISTLILIAVALLSLTRDGQFVHSYTLAITGGLLLSMGGDVSLMFMNESQKAFRTGLVLFLLAHIVYAIIFTMYSGFQCGIDLLSGGILLAIGAALYIFLYPGLGNMKISVLAYILIISLMVNRAVSTFEGSFFNSTQAWMLTIGAGLFYISDIFIALNRFWKPIKYNRISLSMYYSGQLLIAMSTGFF